jgi:flagellar biosynthetic protein FliQ
MAVKSRGCFRLTQEQVLTITSQAIWTIIQAAAPPLILGLVVGILVSLLQTITSIQEPTLAFVPKILAVFAALVLFGPWMLSTLTENMYNLYTAIPDIMGGGS